MILSRDNLWSGPDKSDLGPQTLPLTVTLPPWSMNVVVIE